MVYYDYWEECRENDQITKAVNDSMDKVQCPYCKRWYSRYLDTCGVCPETKGEDNGEN